MKKHHQAGIWQRELKRPPKEAVEAASIRMKQTCEEPSGFCDLLVSDACQCPHLAKWLPNMIDLNHVFCKNANGPRSAPLILANPIHALHMSSQLEENSTLQDQSVRALNAGTSPWMYGEEQQRTIAFSQAGVASGFFPLTTNHIFHQFNQPNPDAPKPSSLHNSNNQQTSGNSKQRKESPSSKKDSSPSSKSKSKSPSPNKSSEPVKKKSKTTSSSSSVPSSSSPPSSSSTAAATATATASPPSSREKRPSVTFASPLAVVQELGETNKESTATATSTKTSTTKISSAAASDDKAKQKKETIGEKKEKKESPTIKKEGKAGGEENKKDDSGDVKMLSSEDTNKKEEGETPATSTKKKEEDTNKKEEGETPATSTKEKEDNDDTGNADVKMDDVANDDDEKEGGETKKKKDDSTSSSSSKLSLGDDAAKAKAEAKSPDAAGTTQPKKDDEKGKDDKQKKSGDTTAITSAPKDKATSKVDKDTNSTKDDNKKTSVSTEDSKKTANEATKDDQKDKKKDDGPVKAKKGGEGAPASASASATAATTTKPTTDAAAKPQPKAKDNGPVEAKEKKKDAASPPSAIAGTASPPSSSVAAIPKPEFLLSEARYIEISRQEDQLKVIRTLLSKRQGNIKKKSKKRKLDTQFHGSAHSALQNLPGSLQYKNERAVVHMDKTDREQWMQEKATANRRVEVWLEQFRSSRRAYWKEQASIQQQQQQQQQRQVRLDDGDDNNNKPKASISFSEWSTEETLQRTCQLCPKSKQCMVGDEVMQCLECGFVGCSPVSIAPKSRHQHILQHLFLSGHKFAVSCGARAEVFCFDCGDFVFHKLFDQERERLDLESKIPWLGWKDHPLQRSFDPLQFAQVEEYGIVWRGLRATYPPLVPQEHVDAAKLSLVRQHLFEGRVMEFEWMIMGRRALDFAIHQNQTAPEYRYNIPAPIGMYNLGQTCFMSAILQCLVHCVPLQLYFLKELGHHHKACEKYRHMDPNDKSKDAADDVCLACEMDSLMLEYYSRSTGRDVVSILKDLSAAPRRSVMDQLNEISCMDEECIEKGEPIIASRMLHVAWKSGGMGHLAGYEQRDAHEFLQAFLDILGKQICQHRARVDASIALAQAGSRFKRQQEQVHHDVIKYLFEGTLRSVLVCESCGTKRTLSEPFLNVSLPLLKELMVTHLQSSQGASKLSLLRCLQHFTAPEKLADPVDCPACGKKTPTKKQHTFSKLPKVLCVHLKRFHAALNKKIEDFVAFPASDLNMGPYLPHWREVTTVADKDQKGFSQNEEPQILYDLFGTVNHQGNLSSGHYTANTKVDGRWYRINDQHVSSTTEATVLTSEGAYILFYARR